MKKYVFCMYDNDRNYKVIIQNVDADRMTEGRTIESVISCSSFEEMEKRFVAEVSKQEAETTVL